ncbi:MAG: hypothetical protein FJ297_00450 [Planctomycetes bacterium]|nr:hypothetical protein [Planctomycetota bacterium]
MSVPKRHAAAAAFLRITPGETTRAAVDEAMGEPKSRSDDQGTVRLTYQVGPFSSVDVTLRDAVVASIRAVFESPKELDALVRELDLGRFAMVADAVPAGSPRGMLVPDRGLRIGLADGPELLVTEIRLEPPAARDFIRRARFDGGILFREQLADLEQALVMEPDSTDALVAIARIWSRAGYAEPARRRLAASTPSAAKANPTPAPATNGESASEAAGDRPAAIRIERARLACMLGRADESRAELGELAQGLDDQPALKCRALLVDADILARQRPPVDSKRVLDRYLAAIDAAERCFKGGTPLEAHDAHDVLLEAHWDSARVIARSAFRNKEETVAKWLANAERLLPADPALDGLSLSHWDHMLVRLECDVELGGRASSRDVEAWLSRAADRWLGAVRDDLGERYVRASHGQGLHLAARSLLMTGDATIAETLADRAADILAATARQVPPHAPSEAWLGQACFLLGSINAVGRRDHTAASRWYDKAIPLLDARRESIADIPGRELGDQMVSIGISQWESGDREEGARCTERGLTLIRESIQAGECPEDAQGVACNNLALMYGELGRSDKAREMAEFARRFEKPAAPR